MRETYKIWPLQFGEQFSFEEFAYRAGYTVGVMLGGTAACVYLTGKWVIEKFMK